MKLNKIIVSLLAAGVMASPLANATNGYFPIGYGQKNEAMGGASIALPLDSIAAANNPAGMVMVGDRMDVGLTWFRPNRNADISGNVCGAGCSFRPNRNADIAGNGAGLDGSYSGNGKSNFFIPSFGYNKMISERTSLGVSVFGNGGMNTQYNTNPFAAVGATGNLGINLEQLFISPTWAMKLDPNNSVGVALNLAYQRFKATGINGPALQSLSSDPTAMSDNGTDTATGYGIRIGWTGEITPILTLGATYQSKTKMSNFDKYKGLFANDGSFDIPSNFGVGIAVKATPETTVAFDYERIQFSDVPAVHDTFPSSLPLGASGGPGFGWQNINVYKLGVSHAYSQTFTVRAGYDHCDQPIPTSQTLLNILAPGIVQDHLSLGGTFTLANKSELTVAYVHAFKKTLNGSNSIPAGFGGGNANISMYEDSIGISYGW